MVAADIALPLPGFERDADRAGPKFRRGWQVRHWSFDHPPAVQPGFSGQSHQGESWRMISVNSPLVFLRKLPIETTTGTQLYFNNRAIMFAGKFGAILAPRKFGAKRGPWQKARSPKIFRPPPTARNLRDRTDLIPSQDRAFAIRSARLFCIPADGDYMRLGSQKRESSCLKPATPKCLSSVPDQQAIPPGSMPARAMLEPDPRSGD